jgi:hypothetical protein
MTARLAQPAALAEKVQQHRLLVDRRTTAHLVQQLQVSHALPVPSEAGRQERLTQVSVLSVPPATTALRRPLIQSSLL